MTPKEITEGNKLIAEFIQYPVLYCKIQKQEGYRIDKLNPEYDDKKWKIITIVNLKYHLSWDWLIPIVAFVNKRIERRQFDFKRYQYIREYLIHDDFMLSRFLNNDIISIFERIVEFIKWYNKTKEDVNKRGFKF